LFIKAFRNAEAYASPLQMRGESFQQIMMRRSRQTEQHEISQRRLVFNVDGSQSFYSSGVMDGQLMMTSQQMFHGMPHLTISDDQYMG